MHVSTFSYPVLFVALFDTEAIDPKIPESELADYGDSILEKSGQRLNKRKCLQILRVIGRGGLKVLEVSPTIAESHVLASLVSGFNEPEAVSAVCRSSINQPSRH